MGGESSRTHDVFLSYSTKDKTWADAACQVLEHHRIRCWIAPRDMTPGDEWGAGIIKGLNASRLMVLIFSDHANASKQVRKEVERAISKDLPVLAFRIQNVEPKDAMEFNLSNIHWLDAFTPPVERQMELLAASVKKLLGQDTGPPTGDGPPDSPPRRPFGKKWMIALTGSLFGLIALALIIVAIVNVRKGAGGPGGPPSASSEAATPSVNELQGPPSGNLGASEFVPLFNGKALSGWRLLGNPKQTWKVLQGGVLEGTGPPTASFLTTDFADFANFHLRVETKISEGSNSQIGFRVTESKGETAKYGAHIAGTNQDENNTGCLRFSMQSAPLTLAKADPVVPIEPGEWFTEEVIADGDVITVIVKGKEVAKFKIVNRKLMSGAIDLTCRGNSRVVYRKIEIKKLDRSGAGGSPASGVDSEKVPGPFEWGRAARITGSGNWQVEGGELVQTADAKLASLNFGDPTWVDYSFSADVKVVQNTSDVGLTFRSGLKGGYWYGVGKGSGAIFRWVDGQFSVLATRRSRDAMLALGRWHTWRIDVKGEKFIAYIDGQLAVAASDASVARGNVGFRVERGACRMRNLRVTAPNGKILWEGLPELLTPSSFGVSLRPGGL